MRNPWVHDDMSESPGSGYDGHVRLLGTIVWGTLLVTVAGFLFLFATGTADLGSADTLLTVGTYVAIALATLLVFPLLLKLLAISRLLGLVTFLATAGLLGRLLWAVKANRIDRFLTERKVLDGASGSLERLTELLDLLLAMTRLTATASVF